MPCNLRYELLPLSGRLVQPQTPYTLCIRRLSLQETEGLVRFHVPSQRHATRSLLFVMRASESAVAAGAEHLSNLHTPAWSCLSAEITGFHTPRPQRGRTPMIHARLSARK